MNRQTISWMGIFAIPLLLSACGGAGGPRAASLSEILNIVQARLIASQSFAAVSNGTAVGVGGQVRTGDLSRVRLDFSDQSILRLGANTLVTIQDVEPSADPFKQLQMETGRIWISIFGGSINVETPVGTTTVRGSHAYIDLDTIKCVHGTCIFRNAFINVTFGTMQGIALLDGGRRFILFDLADADVDNFPPSTSATLTAEATRRTATPTSTSTSTSTSTRTATTTPTGALFPTSTPTPTDLFTATPRALACLEPPNPFDPPAGKAVNSTSTIFRWTSNYALKSDEVFHVLVWTSGAQPNSIGGTRDLNLPVDLQKWQFAGAYSNYNWTVQIRRLDGTVLSCAGPSISITYSAPPAPPPPAPTAVPPPPPTAVPPTAVRGDKPTATRCLPGTTCK